MRKFRQPSAKTEGVETSTALVLGSPEPAWLWLEGVMMRSRGDDAAIPTLSPLAPRDLEIGSVL